MLDCFAQMHQPLQPHPKEAPQLPHPRAPRLDPWAESLAAAAIAPTSAPMAKELQSYVPRTAEEVGLPLRAPHPKEVEKPKLYDGNAAAWRLWTVSFKRMLRRNDLRWERLLEAVEQPKGRPVEEADEAQWWATL